MYWHLVGIEIEAYDPTSSARALPLKKFLTGRHERELAPESSQCRTGQITDYGLTLVPNAFFVDDEQMTWRTEPEFELVAFVTLDDLESDAIPRDRATAGTLSRDDFNRSDIPVFAIMESRGLVSPRRSAVVEAAVDPQ
jgi:hypothetical protein